MAAKFSRFTRVLMGWWRVHFRSGRKLSSSLCKPCLELLEDRIQPSHTPLITTDPEAIVGSGSLRDCIRNANENTDAADYIIELKPETYYLRLNNETSGPNAGQENAGLRGDLDITNTKHTLIIQGTVAKDGSSESAINAVALGDRMFHIAKPGIHVIFRYLTLFGGTAPDDGSNYSLPGKTESLGGVILSNGGNIELDHVIITDGLARGGDGADGYYP